jgi:hypothetical protein
MRCGQPTVRLLERVGIDETPQPEGVVDLVDVAGGDAARTASTARGYAAGSSAAQSAASGSASVDGVSSGATGVGPSKTPKQTSGPSGTRAVSAASKAGAASKATKPATCCPDANARSAARSVGPTSSSRRAMSIRTGRS